MEVGHSPVVLEVGVAFDAIEGGVPEVVDVDVVDEFVACDEFEILAHHTTGASNGPTEGLNLLVKDLTGPGGTSSMPTRFSSTSLR